MEKFRGESPTERSSESSELFDMLDALNEIEAIIGWLVEVGPSANPILRSIKRARLAHFYEQLGIDPDNPDALNIALGLRRDVNSRIRKPQPVVDIPEPRFFELSIQRIIHEKRRVFPYRLTGADTPILDETIGFAHTDWRDVHSRTSKRTDAEYMHDVATIMADPIAYHGVFLSRDIAGYDGIALDQEWHIMNGRHRSLAARCLGPDYVREAGISDWVRVSVEPI